jgi:hypothetical protein
MIRYCLLLIVFAIRITPTLVHAQSLESPKNLSMYRAFPIGQIGNGIQISWDSVSGASDYLIDVAADSNFSRIVFGLQNFSQSLMQVYFDGEFRQVYIDQQRLGKNGVIFFNRCNTQLFTRVRAIANGNMQSRYSSTASIILNFQPCIPSPPPLPDASIGRVQRKTISYYEGPLVYAGGFQRDSLVYYFFPERLSEFLNSDSLQKLSAQSNEALVQLLENNNIPIDTVWCHAGGSIDIRYPVLQGPPSPSRRNFFVKLRRPDARIKGYGFIDLLSPLNPQGNSVIYWWRYSDSFTYYRYTLNTTSSVVSRTSFLTDIQFSPQPCQEIGYISYALHQAGAVRIQLFNILGIPLFSVFEGWQSAGEHRIPVDTQQLPSGTYILHVHSNSPTGTIGFKPLPISIIH